MNGSGSVNRVERRARKRELLLADEELGKIPDRIMARRHDVAKSTVYKTRKYAGIKSTRVAGYGSAEKMVLAQDDLGEVIDMVIAKRLGLADTTVCHYRNKAGILPYAPQFSQHLRIRSNKSREMERTANLMMGWGR